jgi:hypothetical protein
MTQLKFVAGLAALLAAFAAGWEVKGWRADKVISDMAAEVSAQAAEAWAGEAAGQVKGLAERDETVKHLTEANKILSQKLREAYEANPDTRALVDTCLPDSIICLLQ